MNFSSDKDEIITSQCEAYEVMKLQKQPKGQTTSGIAIEQTYEEVGEGLTSSRRGPQHGSTPPQGKPTQQMYDEVGEGLTPSRQSPQTGATPPQERSSQQMYEEVAVAEEKNSQKQFSTQQGTETSAL